jgi:hypothetical protein
MKKISLVLLLLVVARWAIVAQNVVSADEQATIKKVIVDESKAFYARDFEKWSSYYRTVPQTYLAFVDKGKSVQLDTWDKIRTFMQEYFDNNANSSQPTEVRREHYSFRKVNPTYVWLTFDQLKIVGTKKESTKELRIIEMIKGEWKIVNRTDFMMQMAATKLSEEWTADKKKKVEEEVKKEGKKSGEQKDDKAKKKSFAEKNTKEK